MPRVVSKKPVGLPTRGKTASNRLRRVDNFILLYEPSLLTRTASTSASTGSARRLSPGSRLFANSLFVDLGFGFDARTTLESAARFRRLNPNLPILGVEIDPQRVEAASRFADAITHFRLGGFNLPLESGESVRLIRAFNVLRQYEEKDFTPAYERLMEYALPGGLMIEGTSNPHGSIWVANLVRKMDHGEWCMEALVFSTNFRLGFDITDFQAVLPKNYIHRVRPGEAIYDFIEAWKRAAVETSHARTFGVRQWLTASAEKLAGFGFDVSTSRKWLSKGYLIWNKP